MPPIRRPRRVYRFKPGEAVPSGLKRMVREQLDAAIRRLTRPVKGRAEAVHEARKSLKKVRAILRLMQKELGSVYNVETIQLRLRGRELSAIRDAAAQIETVDLVAEKAAEELGAVAFAQIRQTVVRRKQKLERDAAASGLFVTSSSALRAVARRVPTWPLKTNGVAALTPGIEKTFRRGRKAFRRAQADPSPEHLHRWRRRVKELWYQLRVLEPSWSHRLAQDAKDLKHLQERLGEHQNLVMLRAAFTVEPDGYGDRIVADEFLRVAAERQEKLRVDTLALGETFYQRIAKEFVQEIERSWKEHSPGKSPAA